MPDADRLTGPACAALRGEARVRVPMRRRRRRIGAAAVAAMTIAALAGCAEVNGGSAGGLRLGDTPAPSPTCAVAAQPGVEPPAGCVVYDPESNMDLNERYRERLPLTGAAQERGAQLADAARAALTGLPASGSDPTPETVADALESVGLDSRGVQVREDHGRILFGAFYTTDETTPASGCVHGSVGGGEITVDAGGIILDGGCLPAVGH